MDVSAHYPLEELATGDGLSEAGKLRGKAGAHADAQRRRRLAVIRP